MRAKTNNPKRILIVDDNPRNIEVVANLLSGHNYEIEFASSGEQALEWIEKDPFDLILMDIMMPGINGYETCRMIKEKSTHKDIPVIFLTAKTDKESLAKAFEAGGVDYVSKPFRSEELLARVATHLELKKNREALLKVNEQLEEKVRQRTRELQKANEQLSIALKDLQELDATKNDFLHMVSHELRTPLNGILGGMELLKMHDFPDDIKEYLKILDLSTRRLERFSYQALNISELQTRGTKAMKMVVFPLSAFLEDFVHDYCEKNAIPEDRLRFRSDTETDTIVADPKYLKKVLTIFAENALEHSGPRHPVHIRLMQEEEENLVCLIKDQGPGFPKAMLKNSMLGFTPGIEHKDQKTGLNLHFAHLIMQHLKGEIQLSNAKEGGAIVKLIFPCCQQ